MPTPPTPPNLSTTPPKVCSLSSHATRLDTNAGEGDGRWGVEGDGGRAVAASVRNKQTPRHRCGNSATLIKAWRTKWSGLRERARASERERGFSICGEVCHSRANTG
ncbi:hypothetical protein JZ751_027126 [Albula glossodonta]|uniref:Uncharacterized protein n=1 Tax=Albula glossodonta TaxID=121402 RepID=A0A8T2NFH9_9TELE|nr:hypothetical protein JZ751_027126 [Albula glossodonta]